MHYSAANYWTPGWIVPRSRVREPFPRRLRRYRPEVFAPPPEPTDAIPDIVFDLPYRPIGFAPERPTVFDLPNRPTGSDLVDR